MVLPAALIPTLVPVAAAPPVRFPLMPPAAAFLATPRDIPGVPAPVKMSATVLPPLPAAVPRGVLVLVVPAAAPVPMGPYRFMVSSLRLIPLLTTDGRMIFLGNMFM